MDTYKETYNFNNPYPAYHCGGLMALYAAIQNAFNGRMNSSVVTRYYASASQTPGLVLGQLSKLANYHLDSLKKGTYWQRSRYKLYSKELLNVSSAISANAVPETLALKEQSIFVLGYYQMSAELERKQNEQDAKKSVQKNQDADAETKNAENGEGNQMTMKSYSGDADGEQMSMDGYSSKSGN